MAQATAPAKPGGKPSKKKANTGGSLLSELFSFRLFKPNSGRIVRQVTLVTLAALLVACGIRTYQLMDAGGYDGTLTLLVAAAIILGGMWFSFRIVNWPRFATFLIDVETEMQKVSWASWDYLIRATIVVITVMFLIGAVLYAFDLFWNMLFQFLGFLDPNALNPEAATDLPAGAGSAPAE